MSEAISKIKIEDKIFKLKDDKDKRKQKIKKDKISKR